MCTGRIQVVVATLDRGELRWARGEGGGRIGLVGLRCVNDWDVRRAGRKEHRQRFWAAIARGLSSEDAAAGGGRLGGGWCPVVSGGWRDAVCHPRAPSGRYLSFAEREEIALLRARGCGVREVARRSVVRRPRFQGAASQCRDPWRWARASGRTAQWHADRRSRRPKPAKLAENPELRRFVQDRLCGAVEWPDGVVVDGPVVEWIGLQRKDRRGAVVEPRANLQSAPPRLPR